MRAAPNLRSLRPQRRAGFTLIEMMNAMVILTVGVFSTVGLLSLSMSCDFEAADYAKARTIAQKQLEYIRTHGVPSSVTSSQTNPTTVNLTSTDLAQLPDPTGANTSGKVVYTKESWAGLAGYPIYEVNVQLNWPEPGKRGNVSFNLDTYVAIGGVTTK